MLLLDCVQAELLSNNIPMPELGLRAASEHENEAFVQFPTSTSNGPIFTLALRYSHQQYPYYAALFLDNETAPKAHTTQYQPHHSPIYFQAQFSEPTTLPDVLSRNILLQIWESHCDPSSGEVILGTTIARFEWIYCPSAQLRQLELIPQPNQSPITQHRRQTAVEATHQTLRNNIALLHSLLTPAQHLEYLSTLLKDSTGRTTSQIYLLALEPLRLKFEKRILAEEGAKAALECIASSPVMARAASGENKRIHFAEHEEEDKQEEGRPAIRKLSLILHPPSSPESTLSPPTSSTLSTPRTITPRAIQTTSDRNRSPLTPSAGSISPPKKRSGIVLTSPKRRALVRTATPIDQPKRMQFPSARAKEILVDQEEVAPLPEAEEEDSF